MPHSPCNDSLGPMDVGDGAAGRGMSEVLGPLDWRARGGKPDGTMTTARIANAGARRESTQVPSGKPPTMHMALLDAGAGRLSELLVIACLGARRSIRSETKRSQLPSSQALLFRQETFCTIENYRR